MSIQPLLLQLTLLVRCGQGDFTWHRADANLTHADTNLAGINDPTTNTIWIVGGFVSSTQVTTFDVENDTMTYFGSNALNNSAIYAYNNVNSVIIDNYMLILGGRMQGVGRLNLLEPYDFILPWPAKSGNWSQISQSSCLLGDPNGILLYAFFGQNVTIFDILRQSIVGYGPTLQYQRDGQMSCILVDSYIYVIGHSRYIERTSINTINDVNSEWEAFETSFNFNSSSLECPDFNNLYRPGLAQIGKHFIYLIGGFCKNNGCANINTHLPAITDVTYFKINKRMTQNESILIEKGSSLPIGLWGAVTATNSQKNQIFVIGGATSCYETATNGVYYTSKIHV